jgi:osmotically-inducible protein OsmY
MNDSSLQTALRAFLRRTLDNDDVDVEVRDGVATLRGRVATATERQAIEDLVRWHDGVVRLESRLRVERAPAR